MSQLALFLLGPARIERDGVPIEVTPRKAIALVAYLALSGESCPRDTLATLLWPEANQKRARAALRSTLWALKKAIGEAWLEIERDCVGLKRGSGFSLDADTFHSWLERTRQHGHAASEVCPACLRPLAKATQLYRGDLLSGFSLRDSPAFDDWMLAQSESLCSQLINALERLVRGHRDRGQFTQAIAPARRWLELDPLNEAVYRQLMLLLTWTGQRPAALQQYQACEQLLQEELGVPPEEQTRRLHQAIQERREPPAPVSPTLRSLLARRHNLPPQPTPFIGREHELAKLDQLLENPACRLLTLLGPGGIGKTRLALQSAQAKIEDFAHGSYFVPLAPLSAAGYLVSAIANALQFSFYGRATPKVQLLDYLREKEMLLVMDNYEHLLEGTDLLIDILQTAPQVKLLVTSRARLNLQWEWLLDIHGLDYPQNGSDDGLEAYSAVQLFLQCARRIHADFTLSTEEQASVKRICQLVEGLPLAIELAAAWVRTHSCIEIAREIEQGIGFLTTSFKDVRGRHRSLRAVFEHSWKLLSEEEQAVFGKLSVFRGGFDLEAATAITKAAPGLLAALIDKSLLHQTPAGRFHILEVCRQYAEERLKEAPKEQEKTRDLHCAYYARLLQCREEDLKGARQQAALEEIGLEIENVRAGWHWSVRNGKEKEIGQSIESLYHFYQVRGWYQEGVEVLRRAVAALGGKDAVVEKAGEERGLVLGRVLARQGGLHISLGQYGQAEKLLQRSLAILRHLDAQRETAFSLALLGRAYFFQGAQPEAKQALQKSLALWREVGEPWSTAGVLSGMGRVVWRMGEYEEANHLFRESLAIYREIGNQEGIGLALNNLGAVAEKLGEYGEARRLYQESLSVDSEIGNQYGMAISTNNLGIVAGMLGEYDEAKRLFQESLAVFREIGDRGHVAMCLDNLGAIADMRGEYVEAKQLLREAVAVFRAVGHPAGLANALANLGFALCALREYPAAKRRFQEALKIATESQSVPIALECLTGMATYLTSVGEGEQAVELLALALNHPATMRETKDKAEQLFSKLESQLPPQAIRAALERSKSRKTEDVVEEILGEVGSAGPSITPE